MAAGRLGGGRFLFSFLYIHFIAIMSAVWKFFSKKGKSEPASCNLCGKIYKTCGNTTNLAAHLKAKHHFAYLQLEKMQNSTKGAKKSCDEGDDAAAANLDASNVDVQVTSPSPYPRASSSNIGNIDPQISQQSQEITENTAEIELELVTQAKKRKQPTLFACLERGASFEEGGQKHSEITQALIYMICKDNLPLSCVEKKGLQKFVRTACPLYKLPSRKKLTHLVEDRYSTMKAVLIQNINEATFLCFTSDILTITNSTRSFLVLTVHFIDTLNGSPVLQNISLCAQKLSQAHTGQYIKECWEEICEDFVIDKNKIVAVTTDGGANIVAAVRLFLGDDHRIPCMAHSLNLIVDGVLTEISAFSDLCNHVKSIVTFFKQSVNAMDQLRSEQEATGKKEGEVMTLIQAVSTRWNSCYDMLQQFVKLSALVAKILATKSQTNRNTPDMVPTSQLNVIRDLVALLGPFKEATEEISGAKYVTSSLAVPISNLIRESTEQATPSTPLGLTVKRALLKKVQERLGPLELNTFLSAATVLDPRFKRIHFNSPIAVANAISKISNDIRSEHKRRGQQSPDLRSVQTAEAASNPTKSSIWARHERLLSLSSNTLASEVPSSGSVPNELKQYLDQPLLERKSDPIKFWVDCRHFTPVLSEIALKYLICQASSVSSERVASAVNLTVPDNRSRLTGEHIKQRVLLMSISDDYWFHFQ